MARKLCPTVLSLTAVIALVAASPARSAKFEEGRIYIEYNSTANDLGFHVALDGEDWSKLRIVNPKGKTIFSVQGSGPYQQLGMTELFFEGAEPSLDDFPLEDLLHLFPRGRYKFSGVTVDGTILVKRALLSHAVPAGPVVSSDVNGSSIIISWDPVTGPPLGFPVSTIQIAGYQVLVDPFQVTLPASATQVTLPPEFVQSLAPGDHPFEVLAIEVSGNQTITEGTFSTP